MKRTFKITSKQIRSNAANAVMECTSEKIMKVTIEPWVDDKSGEQRGWFHALCKLFSDETGYTPAEIKEMVKKEILGTKMIELNGKSYEVTESSEAQDKIGYSELIDGIYRIAAEAGVVLPSPRWNG